jgi:acetylornithine deacetylase
MMSKTETLLQELISIPSVNPAFLQQGDPHAGEKSVGEFLAKAAARAGLDVKFEEVLPGRSNLLARLAPRGKVRQRILLAPHLDTVNAAETQFKPRKTKGRIVGRGACDAKGSVAVMLDSVCDLATGGRRPAQTEIVFAGLVDEEHAQAGARALAASGLKAELAIVGEPTCEQIVTAHKGSLWLELKTSGKAAHGARPELGVNAVHQMAKVVDVLETEYAARLRTRRHKLLGFATVSVGIINGGTQPNIVPDHCTISIDRRTLPGETQSLVRHEIQSILRKCNLRARVTNGKLAPCLPLETDPRLPLAAQFLRCAGQERPMGVHYFCDASVLAHGGIPSIVFGPGDIAHAHTADEWISLKSLERAKALLLTFLQSLA